MKMPAKAGSVGDRHAMPMVFSPRPMARQHRLDLPDLEIRQ